MQTVEEPSRGNVCVTRSVIPDLCDPINGSPPGSSVLGVLQARILEWVAMPHSRSSQTRDRTHMSLALQADSLTLSHCRSPQDEMGNLYSPISVKESTC